jgi:hypothetical protein
MQRAARRTMHDEKLRLRELFSPRVKIGGGVLAITTMEPRTITTTSMSETGRRRPINPKESALLPERNRIQTMLPI